MVKISVVIPIYNDEKHLRESLDSVCRQTLTDIEIICINDGSTDRSPNILNEYSKNDDRLIILNQENQGPGIARNNGLDIAQGEYIGFLDADDIYINNKSLEVMLETGAKYGAEMISANLDFLTPERKIIPNHHYTKGTFHYFSQESEISPDNYGIPFYFYKNLFQADLIKDIRFPNLSRGEDPVFLSKVLSAVDRIYGVPIDFYGYMAPTSLKKLDSYTKKYHHIYHFKECIDILNKSNLSKTSDRYTQYLTDYLYNTIDAEIYDIVCDVFDMEYFRNHEEKYESFKKSNILNKIHVENTSEYYLKARNELNLKPDSLTEYKKEYFRFQLNKKEKEHDMISHENKRLMNEYMVEKSFNEEIKNSKSWKIMNKFRKVRG